MAVEYAVDTFIPTVKGFGAEDKGWRLHKADYREVKSAGGCGATTGTWLVCVFEKQV